MVSYAGHTELTLHNRANGTSTLLFAVLPKGDEPLFGAAPTGSFSVETYACPAGMTLAAFDPGACQRSASPLVTWSLASDHFTAPLDPAVAAIEGAKTTWHGLPVAVYFVELTAEAFAPGYADYYIPGSDQVTRQDERTTRIYYDAVHATGSFKAYVFTKR
jgi:hypothetical protein